MYLDVRVFLAENYVVKLRVKAVNDTIVLIKNNKSGTNVKRPQDIVHPGNYHD
jgi:hypothetical protein